MKNKLQKEVLIIIILTLLISVIINMSFQFVSDRYFDDEMDNYISSVAKGNRELDPHKLRQLDDSEFMSSIYINLLSIVIGGIFLWLSIRKKAIYIKELSDSLIYIGEGNLDYTVPLRQDNELTELASSINEMSLAFKERITFEKEQEKKIALKEKDFLIGISHDIRTPLTSITGYLHVLKDKQYKDEDERDRYTEIMIDKVYLLKKLTDTLLDNEFYSNTSINSNESMDKSRFLQTTLEVFRKQIDKAFIIDFSDLSSNFEILEIVNLNRVISNLISNLDKYADKSQAIQISLYKKCDFIELSITNKSIDSIDDLYHKFTDKFYRLDTSRKLTNGYGLGLSICKDIMESQDGYLNLKSQENNLTVTLGFRIKNYYSQ